MSDAATIRHATRASSADRTRRAADPLFARTRTRRQPDSLRGAVLPGDQFSAANGLLLARFHLPMYGHQARF